MEIDHHAKFLQLIEKMREQTTNGDYGAAHGRADTMLEDAITVLTEMVGGDMPTLARQLLELNDAVGKWYA